MKPLILTKHLRLGALLALALLTSTGCDLLEFSPNDHRVPEEFTDLTQKNLARLQAHPLPAGDTLRFVFTGDSQQFYDEAEAMVGSINQQPGIQFMIVAGDISDFGLAREMRWVDEKLRRLKVPYLTVVGNHDLVGNGREAYQHIYGALDYSFVYGDTKFIMVDTNGREYNFDGTSPNLPWLQRELRNTEGAQRQVVVSHVPPDNDDFDPALRPHPERNAQPGLCHERPQPFLPHRAAVQRRRDVHQLRRLLRAALHGGDGVGRQAIPRQARVLLMKAAVRAGRPTRHPRLQSAGTAHRAALVPPAPSCGPGGRRHGHAKPRCRLRIRPQPGGNGYSAGLRAPQVRRLYPHHGHAQDAVLALPRRHQRQRAAAAGDHRRLLLLHPRHARRRAEGPVLVRLLLVFDRYPLRPAAGQPPHLHRSAGSGYGAAAQNLLLLRAGQQRRVHCQLPQQPQRRPYHWPAADAGPGREGRLLSPAHPGRATALSTAAGPPARHRACGPGKARPVGWRRGASSGCHRLPSSAAQLPGPVRRE